MVSIDGSTIKKTPAYKHTQERRQNITKHIKWEAVEEGRKKKYKAEVNGKERSEKKRRENK